MITPENMEKETAQASEEETADKAVVGWIRLHREGEYCLSSSLSTPVIFLSLSGQEFL